MDPNYALGVSMNNLKKAHQREQLNKKRRKEKDSGDKEKFQIITNKDSGDIGNTIYNSPTLNTSLKTAHGILNIPTTSTDNIFVESTGDY